jgi:hypothetical protein
MKPRSDGEFAFLLILGALAIVAAILFMPALIPGLAPTAAQMSASREVWLLGWTAWLVPIVIVGASAYVYGLWLARRRYLGQMTIADATATPLPPRPEDLMMMAQLNRLGFYYLGEMYVRSRFGPRARSYVFAEPTGLIRAEMMRPGKGASFSSVFSDDSMLATSSARRLRIQSSLFVYQNADGIDQAYALHLATMPQFAELHGAPVRMSTMADVVAFELHSRDALTPIVVGRNRLRQHAFLIGLIAGACVLAAASRPF